MTNKTVMKPKKKKQSKLKYPAFMLKKKHYEKNFTINKANYKIKK